MSDRNGSARGGHEWFRVLTPLCVPCDPINDMTGVLELAERLGLGPRATGSRTP